MLASILLTVLAMCLRQSGIQVDTQKKEEKDLLLDEFSSTDEY